MNIVRFNLWDYFKYARILNLSLKGYVLIILSK